MKIKVKEKKIIIKKLKFHIINLNHNSKEKLIIFILLLKS